MGQVATISHSLHTRSLNSTRSTAEDGDALMNTLANGEICTLQKLEITNESNWFANGRQECLESLLVVIQRQTELKLLQINWCGLTD